MSSDANATADIERVLQSYDGKLLRRVAQRLRKPRNQWPATELIERCLGTLVNTPVLDRRLRDLAAASRLVLDLIRQSRQPRWRVGALVEMNAALGAEDGLAPVLELLESGLLFPEMREGESIADFGTWLARSDSHRPARVFAPPLVLDRLGALPAAPLADSARIPAVSRDGSVLEADGLQWPLRLSVLWQQVSAGSLRRTLQQDLFKRDLDRLRADPLLAAAPVDALTEAPDLPLLTLAWGLAVGVLKEEEGGEIQAGSFDDSWGDVPGLLARLWAALPELRGWNPSSGWNVDTALGNPYPSAYLLALLLLTQLRSDESARPADLDDWMLRRHPFWASEDSDADENGIPRKPARAREKRGLQPDLAVFLLGVAYPLRMIEVRRDEQNEYVVRLSEMGRWIMDMREAPPAAPAFPQTLLMQPNLEILAYRQGLSPDLIVRLGRIAVWKTIGPACTLQLEPGSVYRALEQGETFESIVGLLESRGMKAVPPPVLEALRTWSNKRQRITVFPSAALFEFPSAAELNDALSRGLNAIRLTDRLAVVPAEKDIDYRHFRLTGTRDYLLPPDQCVEALEDGVTLSVDLSRSDLLLESEVTRFAELAPGPHPPGRRLYRVTPGTMQAARRDGLSLGLLETWFRERTGLPLPPAARLLFSAADLPPVHLRRQIVVHVALPETADGLQQWPGTRGLIKSRLGPHALVVMEKDVEELRQRCAELGVKLQHGEE